MMVFLSIFLVGIFCQVLLGKSQETLVYIGTGVNGTNVTHAGNDIVMLGGLFAVNRIEDGKCVKIFDPSVQRVEAMVLAIQTVNDDPALLPGVTIGFEIRETCTQSNKALEQSLHFVTGRTLMINNQSAVLGISGVIGATWSSVSSSVARLLRLFDVPQISSASTASILSDKTTFDNFFRTLPSDSLQAQTIADVIDHFNWTYVIAVHTGDIYGREGIRSFISEMEKRNSTQKCIATASIELSVDATDEDFDNAIEKINQEWVRNASVVVIFGQVVTANGILDATRRRRVADPGFASRDLTWIASDAWGEVVPKDLMNIAHGLLGVIPQSSLSEEFDKYFQSLHPNNNSGNPWFHKYWEDTFNCSLKEPPSMDFSECDLEAQSISFDSGYRQEATVPFTMDAVYAFAHAIHKLQQDFCNGRPGLCQEILDTRSGGVAIRGDYLLQYLHNISFSGVSSEVIDFDENGDQQGGYLVKNLQKQSNGEFAYADIGQWDEIPTSGSSHLSIFDSNIQWSHGSRSIPDSMCSHPCGNGEYPEPIGNQAECCWVCKPCSGDTVVSTGLVCIECAHGYAPNVMKTECEFISPTYLKWSDWWSVVFIIMSGFGITATAVVAIIFTVHQKHKLVKASSRELTTLLLSGIALCYILPFFFIAKPSPWICGIRRFGVGLCFSVCYSALLVKTNRIHRIFNRSRPSTQSPPLISPCSQIFFTTLLVAIQGVIAAIWLAAQLPDTEFVYGRFSTELRCAESFYIGLSVTLGYNFLLLVITTYFAFRTRKVPRNFNETKYISFTMYTLCILWCAFIAGYIATAVLRSLSQTRILVLAIILNASVTLCILFAPKIYYLLIKKTDSEFETKSTAMPTPTIISLRSPAAVLGQTDASNPTGPAVTAIVVNSGHLNSADPQTTETTFGKCTDVSTQTCEDM